MTFAERLQTKIRVDRLTGQIVASLKPVNNYRQIDKKAMRSLLDMAGYQSRLVRDLEVYALDFDDQKPEILVLDSELKFFHTTLDDIALRKAPLLKEMVKLSGIFKILNDAPVVGTRGEESVRKIRHRILTGLDLSFTPADLETLAGEGGRAFQEQDMGRVDEILALFSELLDLKSLPSPIPQTSVWKMPAPPVHDRDAEAQNTYHQIILVGHFNYLLNRYVLSLDAGKLQQSETILDLLAENPEPREKGEAVFNALKQELLDSGATSITI